MRRVVILGASSHIAKNFIIYLSKEEQFKLLLFTRSKEKTYSFLNSENISNCEVKAWSKKALNSLKIDVIINCIGVTDPDILSNNPAEVFAVSELVEQSVIEYLHKRPATRYINMSSGAVYGENFVLPAGKQTLGQYPVNKLTAKNFYGVVKLYTEARHRALFKYDIVDLRVFGFLSKYMDIKTKYFLTDIISAIKSGSLFKTSSADMYRDYIHPKDLVNIIKLVISSKKRLNKAYDVYSSAPISKMNILKYFSENYYLKIKYSNVKVASPTGEKANYYSKNKLLSEIGYKPHYSSLECLKEAASFLLKS